LNPLIDNNKYSKWKSGERDKKDLPLTQSSPKWSWMNV
jgi:hypothetical protein